MRCNQEYYQLKICGEQNKLSIKDLIKNILHEHL